MATAETKPKKVRKTLGDVLMQSAKEQLRASDTAERMKRLEEVAPPLAATLPSPPPPNPLPADDHVAEEAPRQPVAAAAADMHPAPQSVHPSAGAAGPYAPQLNGLHEPIAQYHVEPAQPLAQNSETPQNSPVGERATAATSATSVAVESSERPHLLSAETSQSSVPKAAETTQSVMASEEHTPSRPITHSVQRSDSSPVWHSDDRSDTQPDTRTDERSIGQTTGRTDARTLGRTLGQTDGHTDALTNAQAENDTNTRSGTPLKARTAARSSLRSNTPSDILTKGLSENRSDARTIGNPSPAESLTAKQHMVLSFLLEHRPRIINCMTIAAYVGGSEDSVRSILTRLRKGGFLEYSKTKIGNMQGLSFRYNEPLCATINDDRTNTRSNELSNTLSGNRTDVQTSSRTGTQSGVRTDALIHGGTNTGAATRSDNQSSDNSDTRSVCQTDWRPDLHHTDNKIDRKNLSISRERTPKEVLLGLTEEDLSFFWPNLAKVDFRKTQIVQIVEKLETLNTPMDDVRKSLDHADYELGAGPLKDAKGNLVADPRSYIFHAIAKTGYYRRPQGYVSIQEQTELDAAEEAKRLAKARAEREEAEFQAWRVSLDPETVQSLLEGRRGPEEVWLRTKWREKRRQGEL